MPGEVIEGHSDIEGECSACHAAFEKQSQNAKCVECHEDVGADIDESRGYHGLFPGAQDQQCKTCHTEHKGRDAIIVVLEERSFDHDMTDFYLDGKHAEVECLSCHEAGRKFRDAPDQCLECHRNDDVHKGNLGEACVDCHVPADWKQVEFDHDTTDYPLLGKHLEVTCLDCHVDDTFTLTPTTCFGCHEKDDVHEGRSGENCENCHSPKDWHDTSFNHDRDTGFRLDGGHAKLTCNDCHSEDPFADTLETTCVSCHLEEDNHEGHFGTECEACHVTESWPAIAFDHDRDTGYAIKGAHLQIACVDCHVDPVFDVPLEATCIACHRGDDVHKAEQGERCENCHNEVSWTDSLRFDHGLTAFPLLGKHADVECKECHETNEFKLAKTECIGCHADANPHQDRYGDDCGLCHNPVDWNLWLFDHNAQTEFVLDGAHTTVACDDCHRQPLDATPKLGNQCGGCHKLDDVHDGEFGLDCGRCHSSTSFREVRSVR